MGRAYGETMGDYFNGRRAPLIVQSAALENHTAITYLRCDGPGTGLTDPIPPEPALLLAVQLQPLRKHELWLDGRYTHVKPYAAGALTMLDLESRPVANLASSYECIQMFFPRAALDELSDAEDTARFSSFPSLNGAEDPVLTHLAQIAHVAISPRGPATSLFLESLLLTVHRHLRTQYAGHREPQSRVRGGLARWQEMHVKEFIEAHLNSSISLLDLAALCRLSPSQFGRAFKVTTGMTPHRWLVERRLARARSLLAMADKTIAEIAQLCGFSDQSHLAREFRRREGVSLGTWRRLNASHLQPLADC